MKAHLVAGNLLKLPVSIGTPVFIMNEKREATLIEYSLKDIDEEVYLTRLEAEKEGAMVIQCSKK